MRETEIDKRIDALAAFLGVSPLDIEYTGSGKDVPDKWGIYLTEDDEEFLVVTNEEANHMVQEVISNHLNDLSWISDMCCDNLSEVFDMQWLEDICRQDCIEEIRKLPYKKLLRECLDYEIIGDDDFEGPECMVDEDYLRELLVDELVTERMEDVDNWYPFHFQYDELEKRLAEGSVELDVNAMLEYIWSTDSRGEVISGWDSDENYSDGYYIYQVGG